MQAYFGWAKTFSCSQYCCSRHLWFCDIRRLGRVEIVTLTVGARAKEGKGEGGGAKKIRLPDIIVLLGNSVRWSSWLVRHREVDWCLSIKCKSILFIPFPSVFWNWSSRECRVYYAMRKSKRFLRWSSGQDLLAVLKPTPLLTHAEMPLVSIRSFFWRVDYALEGSMFWLSKCVLAACFTLRGHGTLIDFLWFLNFWSSWFALWCKSVFFDLWSSFCR